LLESFLLECFLLESFLLECFLLESFLLECFLLESFLTINFGNSGNSGYRQHILIALLCDFFVASDLSCKAVVRSNGV